MAKPLKAYTIKRDDTVLHKDERYKQGFFTPINKQKCINKDPIIYRSSYEMFIMLFLDKKETVLEWGSETHDIWYELPCEVTPKYPTGKRPAKYIMDFYVKTNGVDGKIRKYLLEFKPERQTVKPTVSKNKKRSTVLYENLTWAKNTLKWEAAKKWCAARGDYTFLIVTEKNIDKVKQIL